MRVAGSLLLVVALALVLAPPVADASGWLIYEQTIRDDNEHDVLPPGSVTVDDLAGVSFRFLSADSSGKFKANSSSNFTYGAGGTKNCSSQVLEAALSEFELCLQVDGGFTIQRTAGSRAIEIVIRVMWISSPLP